MLRITQVLLISLFSLSHYVLCNDFEDNIQEKLSNLSKKMGSCFEYFQYQLIDEFINGKLALPNIKMGDTVKLIFYRDEFENNDPHFKGILLPDESSRTVFNKIQNGQLILYRVDFPLIANVPELSKIFVNGKELCTTQHNRSSETLALRHTMRIVNGSLPVFTYNINIPHFFENATCGIVDEGIAISGLTPFIYGGTEIVRGEYPWLAAIYRKQRNGINFLCGGSLISTRIILTAAHCFQGSFLNPNNIAAVLGRYNLSNFLEDNYVRSDIEELILNPEYKVGVALSDADIAILRLKRPVSFSKFIKPICLWLEVADESLIVNHEAVVAGWGSDEDGNTLSAVPKKVSMNIVSEVTCLRSSWAFKDTTTSRTLCAGNRDGTGPCEGDSGGGLMINRYGRWMLRGVVSTGLTDRGRCNLQEYTIYSDIAKHKKWLENYVGKEKLLSGFIDEICGISGTELRNENPWLAAVYSKVPTGLRFLDTGTLISARTVLFRAGWLVVFQGENISPDELKIFLGRYDLNNIHENAVVARDVESFVFHPDYDKSSLDVFQENGIALIQMKSPVGFTDYVKPICLWSEPNDDETYISEQSATLSSWDIAGVFWNNNTLPTSIKVKETLIAQCQSWGYDESKSSQILCVPRLEHKNGAIMMLKRNERWLLRGINALRGSYDTCRSKNYFVFYDITKYLTWIKKNMLS